MLTIVALHYKLTMEDKDENDPHGQLAYTPLLDPDRDEKLLKVLPDYLTDEILFTREQGISLHLNRSDKSKHVFLATQSISTKEGRLNIVITQDRVYTTYDYY